MLSHPLFPRRETLPMSQTSPILALQPGAEMPEQLGRNSAVPLGLEAGYLEPGLLTAPLTAAAQL